MNDLFRKVWVLLPAVLLVVTSEPPAQAQRASQRSVGAQAVQPLAGNPGAVWTTSDQCGEDQQNVNEYTVGTYAFINGDNFDPGLYDWTVYPPGEAENSVANGHLGVCGPSETCTCEGYEQKPAAYGDCREGPLGPAPYTFVVYWDTQRPAALPANPGTQFCFVAYQLRVSDDGVYKYNVGKKNDNFHATGSFDITKAGTVSVEETCEWSIEKTVDEDAWWLAKSTSADVLFAPTTGTSNFTVTLTKEESSTGVTDITSSITLINDGNVDIKNNLYVWDCVLDASDDPVVCLEEVVEPDAAGITIAANSTRDVSLTKVDFEAELGGPLVIAEGYSNWVFVTVLDTEGVDPDNTPEGYGRAFGPVAFETSTIRTDCTVQVTDNNPADCELPAEFGTDLTAGDSWEYACDYSCDDEGTIDNVAKVMAGTTTLGEDDASVEVVCEDFDKATIPVWDAGLTWEIEKAVEPDEWHVFAGDKVNSKFTIEVTMTEEDEHIGLGSNVVAPTGAVDCITEVGDAAAPGAIIVCNDTPAAGDEPYDWAFAFDLDSDVAGEEGSGESNHCTENDCDDATFWNCLFYDWDTETAGEEPVLCTAFTLTAPVATEEIGVTDTNGKTWTFVDSGTETYEMTYECASDLEKTTTTDYANTASIDDCGAGQEAAGWVCSDDASVKVMCHVPVVTKAADASFTRKYNWDILKKAWMFCDTDCQEVDGTIVLGPDDDFDITYTIEVGPKEGDPWDDGEIKVSGKIQIYNDNPFAALAVDVSDMFEGVPAVVDCGGGVAEVTVPKATVPDAILPSMKECDYTVTLTAATDGTNEAKAEWTTYSYDWEKNPTELGTADATGTDDAAFTDPTEEVDKCIVVADTWPEFAAEYPDAEVCLNGEIEPFEYTKTFGPLGAEGCDLEKSFENTASFETVDDAETGESSVTVKFKVPCPGCTLTQGYWKTHSDFKKLLSPNGKGPMTDPAWGQCECIDDGAIVDPRPADGPACESVPTEGDWMCAPDEDDDFFLADAALYSWIRIMFQPPKGNPYFSLAHQYVAATMNYYGNLFGFAKDFVNEGDPLTEIFDPADAAGMYHKATVFLEKCSPTDVLVGTKQYAGGGTGTEADDMYCDKPTADMFASWLGQLNEGCLDVPHCTEDLDDEEEICEADGAVAVAELPEDRADYSVASDADVASDASEAPSTLEAEPVPTRYELEGNYPNPFNPQTTIRIAVPETGQLTLTVYDVMGRTVTQLVNGTMKAGYHELVWPAPALPSGTYFVVMRANDFTATHRMLLLK